MKGWRLTVLFCLLAVLFILPAGAEEDWRQEYAEQAAAGGLDRLEEALPEDARRQLAGWGLSPTDPDSLADWDAAAVMGRLGELAATAFSGPLTAGTAAGVALLVCGLFGGLRGDRPGGDLTLAAVGTLCVCSVLLVPLMQAVRAVGQALSLCAGFMLIFVPVYAGILLAGGQAVTAARGQAVVFGASQFLAQAVDRWFAPAAGGILAVAAVGGLFPAPRLDGLLRGLQRTVQTALGVGMTVYTALLGITGAVGTAADSLALRTGRFAATLVPVVGGAVGEALGTAAACLAGLRATAGAYALLALAALLLPALVQLILWRLVLAVTAAAADALSVEGISRLLGGVGAAVGLLLALTVCLALAFVLAVSLLMLAGGRS